VRRGIAGGLLPSKDNGDKTGENMPD
jgi:hypothetical protein